MRFEWLFNKCHYTFILHRLIRVVLLQLQSASLYCGCSTTIARGRHDGLFQRLERPHTGLCHWKPKTLSTR